MDKAIFRKRSVFAFAVAVAACAAEPVVQLVRNGGFEDV